MSSWGYKVPDSILIAVEDQFLAGTVKHCFREIGSGNIEVSTDGINAFGVLQSRRVDFIVMAWKLKGLSGLALYNRLRSMQSKSLVPVLVLSDDVLPEDFSLLQEFPCTRTLKQSSTQGQIHQAMESLAKESQWYAKHTDFLDDLFDKASTDPFKVKQSIKELIAKAPNPIPVSLLCTVNMSDSINIVSK